MDDVIYMREALKLAAEALAEGEVPVGCVIADAGGKIVGRGRNRREIRQNALAHAEVEAINEACGGMGNWRLDGCTLFVTLEPCPMCAGAVMNARISTLVYGAKESRSGSCGSVINLFMESYGSSTRIIGGVLEAECAKLLSTFFAGLRHS